MRPGFRPMSQDAPAAFRSRTHILVSASITIWDWQRYQENLPSHQVSGEILSHYSGPSRAGSRFWLPRLGDCEPWPLWWLEVRSGHSVTFLGKGWMPYLAEKKICSQERGAENPLAWVPTRTHLWVPSKLHHNSKHTFGKEGFAVILIPVHLQHELINSCN